ncbi:hypothetical protein EV702DRAFT_1147863 [Suillus placidus]|uniref:Uncharacterized protein n=1 Tax=Suillus placidus TaxID=48579 RepID=A0A9P7CWP2_9AGAM|nr:hypothetical protein EV702DRAFT_1147863 [Suillus placidus]
MSGGVKAARARLISWSFITPLSSTFMPSRPQASVLMCRCAPILNVADNDYNKIYGKCTLPSLYVYVSCISIPFWSWRVWLPLSCTPHPP